MKKKPFLALCILLIMIFAVGLTACNGSYAMEEFIVDFSKFQKEYEVGDTVDLSKIGISASFNDGTTEQLPLNRVTLLLDGEKIGLDELSKITETTGTKTLEIKFTDIVKSVVITVNEKYIPTLTGVEMVSTNVTKEYVIGDDVSFAGLKIYAVYDNGAKKEEIALADENVTVFMNEEIVTGNYNRITEEIGTKNIKIRYTVFNTEDSFTVTVTDVKDRVVISLPENFKTTYKVGGIINVDGISAKAEYRSGRKDAIDEIKYFIGTEEVNFNTLTATRGSKTVVAKAVSGNLVGTREITFDIQNYVNSISLDTADAVLNYTTDDDITVNNFSGVKANVVYADSQDNKQIALTEEGVVCFNVIGKEVVFSDLTNTAGEKIITVSYGGKNASIAMTVTDGETDLENLIVTAPTKTEYIAGETDVTFAGLSVLAQYKTATPDEEISVSEFAAKGVEVFYYDKQITDYNDITKINSVGSNQALKVEIRYAGKTASFDITVTNAVTGLVVNADNVKTEYKLNEPVDFSDLTITATLNYGTKIVALDDVAFFDGTMDITNDLNSLTSAVFASKEVIVSYGGQSDSFEIVVGDEISGISFGEVTSFTVDVDTTLGAVYSFPELQVYVDYKSGARDLIATGYTFSNNGITVPTSGKTVTVTYGDCAGTITLIVNDVLESIKVGNIPMFVRGTDAAKTLKNITVTGTYAYKGQNSINILQEDGQSFLFGVVFSLKESGEEYETMTQLELNRITSQSGDRYMKLTYTEGAHTVSDEFVVSVTASTSGIDEFSKPQSITMYESALTKGAKENKTTAEFESSFFVDGTEEYLVGDDNPFKFVPTLKQVNMETGYLVELNSYKTTSKVYYEGNALTESIEGNKKKFSLGSTLMVEENFNQNTFQFTSDAIGKSFKLSVLPSKDEFDYDDGDFAAVEWTVKIVDGYNVTDPKELCLLEQSSRTLWNEIKAELGLTGRRPNAIILHQNTEVTKDSIPSAMYYTLSDSYNIKYKYTDSQGEHVCAPEDVPAECGGPLTRTFLWSGEWPIFEYDMTVGASFTFYGNFFDLNMTKMPLVAAFEPTAGTANVPDTNKMSGTYYGSYMSEVSFLEVRGIEGTTGVDDDETFTFNNFAVKGNAAIHQVLVDGSSAIQQGADNPVFGGGLIFVKTRYCTSDIVNIHAHACFIPFYSRNETMVNYTNAKAYDSFQNALFVNCDSVNYLHNCYFKRAGGPLMILVENTKDVNGTDVKVIPKVYADDDCELESIVDAYSQWFVTYGVTGNVAQLASLDPLLQGYFERSLLDGSGKYNVIAVTIENGGGGSAGTQAYMSYKNNAINRLDGQATFETTKTLAGYGFGAFFVMGDVYCTPFTTDNKNYSLVKLGGTPEDPSFDNVATDMTVQGAFRNPDNQYVAIYAGGMGILAELY